MTIERAGILYGHIGDGSGATSSPFSFKVFASSHIKAQAKAVAAAFCDGLGSWDITLAVYDTWLNGAYRATCSGKKAVGVSGCRLARRA